MRKRPAARVEQMETRHKGKDPQALKPGAREKPVPEDPEGVRVEVETSNRRSIACLPQLLQTFRRGTP